MRVCIEIQKETRIRLKKVAINNFETYDKVIVNLLDDYDFRRGNTP